jgi:hypothetical protein
VVLVPVVEVRREHEIGRERTAVREHEVAHRARVRRQDVLGEAADEHVDRRAALRGERACRVACFGLTLGIGRRDDDAQRRIFVVAQQPEDRRAGADLDVVAVRGEREHPQRVTGAGRDEVQQPASSSIHFAQNGLPVR